MENVETGSFLAFYERIDSAFSTIKSFKHGIGIARKRLKNTVEKIKLVIDFGVKLVFVFLNWLIKIYELLPHFVLVFVHDAYEKGDREFINLFFSDFLDFKLTSNNEIIGNRIEALFWIIDSPDWLTKNSMTTDKMIKYLNYTIPRRAKGINQERNKSDNITRRYKVSYIEDYRLNINKSYKDPLKVLIEQEVSMGLLSFIKKNIKQLNPLEQQIFQLLLKGSPKAECAKEIGCNRQHVQSFHLKMLRKKKKYKLI